LFIRWNINSAGLACGCFLLRCWCSSILCIILGWNGVIGQ
jgi:hypothetical protein